MLRSILIYLSKADWMRRVMLSWGIARRVALRFVAGETLDDAIETVRVLNEKGMTATLDQLGEDTYTVEEARQTTQEIIEILRAIHASDLRSGLSIKLTQIGVALDENVCAENLTAILEEAKKLNIFVRIDMEDSECVDVTMRLYECMRNEKGLDNVGMVLQSYLYRTPEDQKALLANNTRVRIVKGAYKEPPEIAFPQKGDVDQAFDELTYGLLDASQLDDTSVLSTDGRFPPIPAIATHDETRVLNAIVYADKIGLAKEKMEFQMLHGIGTKLQRSLVEQGYPVRVYVPFGEQWYPYFMRRLAERPANLWFFISSFLRG